MPRIRWWELPEARQLARLGRTLSRPAQNRLQWMLFYFFNGRNAARTCRHFAISRQTFYRWWRRFDRHQSLAFLTPFEFLTQWKQNHGKAKCH